jgi:hypothetical protein
MSKRNRWAILGVAILSAGAVAQAQTAVAPCPGYNPVNNTNLACEIATATRTSGSGSLGPLSATLAAQLSALPTATAVSGTGVSFVGGVGVFGASATESLGTILTQRAETIGKHKFFASFNYQRFGFGSIDGVRLKNLQTVIPLQTGNPGSTSAYILSQNSLSLRVDQYTAIASFGITDRLDLSLVVPFSTVRLNAKAVRTAYFVSNNGTVSAPVTVPSPIAGQGSLLFLPGRKTGPGDITLNAKYNAYKGEKTGLAVGTEFRIPTGDELNYLGTGAYGFKPYLILSRHGRLTPNVNVAYQWNSTSSLYTDNNGTQLNLPSSFHYSGGADFKITKRFTVVGEYIGQYVINGPRVGSTDNGFVDPITGASAQGVVLPGPTAGVPDATRGSVTAYTGSYATNDAGVGFKFNPFKGLLISASALFKLDDAGMRAKVIPLAGISYRF